MRKFLLSLIAITTICTNAWGDGSPWTCGNVIVTLNESTKTLTLSPVENSDGVMENLTEAETLWRASGKRGNVRTIIIEDGVTYIGEYAFYYCLNITSIEVPLSVTSFGSKAFYSTNSAQKIYYEGSPNQWAKINFADGYSHPFYGGTGDRHIYFNDQKTTETTELVLTAGLTRIEQYAFYKANQITNVYIPGTVTTINQHALDCGITRLYINKKKAPTTGTTAISWTTSSDTYLYLREDATNSYNNTPWYHPGTSRSDGGAYYLGYSKDNASIITSCAWRDNRYVYKVGGDIGTSISWTLDTLGTLTLTGTGNMPKTFNAENTSENVLPWYRFRYLIKKVVIQGGITGLTSSLSWAYGLCEIDINQNAIPTSTTSEGNINNNFNIRDNIVVKIKAASLIDESASNLGVDPWDISKLDIQLSDNLEISDDDDYTNLIDSCKKYVEKPITLQLGRSLSNEYYNTFCSPINMDAALVESTFGAGTKIYSFAGTSYDEEKDELSLNFNESQDHIDAGVPYLIWPTNNVSNPSFTNVDPDDVATSAGTVEGKHATFYGTLAPVNVSDAQIDAKSFIFLQANNTLNWASEGTLYGMRAYWLLTGDVPARALAKRPVMKIGQTATAIEEVRSESANTMRSEKIMRNGQIFIMRGEHMYNAQGQMMK